MSRSSAEAVRDEATPSRARARATVVTVEAFDLAGAAGHRDAWADLARRALEPDVFLDPLFALPAARRLPPARRPTFLLAWASDPDGRATLIGLCPVRTRSRWPGPAVTAVWTHEQSVVAAPLVDADRAVEALTALLGWSARVGRGSLLCRGMPLEGPLGRLLTGSSFRHAVLATRTRAVLTREGVGAHGGGRAREWRRQHRRLLDRGPVTFRSAREVEAVRVAVEAFLTLEASGWKGARGTALRQDPALALFARTLTDDLAREGRCRIDSLDVDGRPVAMGVVLQSRDRAYYWKTAFDEGFAALSPGRQFTLALTAAQLREPGVALTDSCALPGHPMIDRLWPGRLVVADLLLASPAASPRLVRATAAVLRAGDRCRTSLKAVYRALRDRRG